MNELIVPIEQKIYEIRGQKVMFDFDLAEMYQTETKLLKRAVRRNPERFPERYMFELSMQEWKELVPNWHQFPENIKHSSVTPFAFTEQGVAMLSAVLHTDIAVQVSINIMDAFVAVRNYLANNVSVLREIEELKKENKLFHSTITEMRKDIDLLKQSERKRLKEENKRDTVEILADRLIHQQEITELFISWADEYFSDRKKFNIRLPRKWLYHAFCNYGPIQRRFISPTLFKKKFMQYCMLKGYIFNPHKYDPITGKPCQFDKNGKPVIDDKSGGIEYFMVSGNAVEPEATPMN
ncbi:hypothetical protein EZS27_003581 [termite gut metagenome]|uniref:KilA-N DNA-binding domain-containing protein n=1 Tax=termite gut metagenome TaxID=433724 RepID=A0A5J4SU37_9ZZZZ